MSLDCPCGSGLIYTACCCLLHDGAPAANAEALMRSRYSAFVLGMTDYLLSSWHPATRPSEVRVEKERQWLGLEIRRAQLLDVDHALVEFVARWRVAGRGQRLHETSRFERNTDGHWRYVDGDLHRR